MGTIRPLHFVFKVGDRARTAHFYRDILGMKVLRHEEFKEGCKAACNGPFDGQWSKTMVGYGPEDDHFVVELTYNYGIGSYKLGNDFAGFYMKSREVIERAKENDWPLSMEDSYCILEAPGGYKFFVMDELQPTDHDPVLKVALNVSNLPKSVKYWAGLLGMTVYSKTDATAELGYSESKCRLLLRAAGQTIDRATAFGRVAFSCPAADLPAIESSAAAAGHTILTPLVSLDTPGKATVSVVILADPDGHEICFVGDEAFSELSKVDPKAGRLLSEAIFADKSANWYAKKGKQKPTA
ncbi:PREDICTED: glyoxalase domain-containing protein 4-like [Priapulus caudatus]|uniref:Glyoxalase domain-containing protein 4-like n=1 Tax=Priapulus caudatus TaxID=37621 RepID=A0ABM1DVP9_PRICU|nr:PREDICTED: glyoxalase domain-containing protein 4-like [Priapulus caudatus]